MKIISFEDALQNSQQYAKRHLLLGNGFSIACVPSIFTYASLFNQADFSKIPEVKEVFEILKSQDFELVVHALENSSLILPVYGINSEQITAKMRSHAQQLKEALIQTLAHNHPEFPAAIDSGKYLACQHFLSKFLDHSGCIYTMNYDLLLYWTLMQGMETKIIQTTPLDGFGKDFDEDEQGFSSYVTWQGDSKAHGQNIHYLHGALHLYDRGPDIEKFTWTGTGVKLIEQAREALSSNRFPLFVSEGDSKKKMEKITHSGYLFHSFKCFSAEMKASSKNSKKCLFTYGVSFSENDDHILRKISAGKVGHLFVSIYGAPTTDFNKTIIQKAEQLKQKRKDQNLEITYYDAASAKVWG